jgi:hypothetical protein
MRTSLSRRSSFSLRLTPLVAALGLTGLPAVHAQTPTPVTCRVTTGIDNAVVPPVGSLREAIGFSNLGLCIGDTISFALGGTPPFIVDVAAPLSVTRAVTIDGNTQSGITAYRVRISGTVMSRSSGGCGLDLSAGTRSTLSGLGIHDFAYGGTAIAVCGRVNLIGSEVANNDIGVRTSDGNIGGTTSAEGNVFTGNTVKALEYTAYGGSLFVLQNKFTNNGFGLYATCLGTGGTVQNNVFTGNTLDAIWLRDVSSAAIVGNNIGQDNLGVAAANAGNGIYIGSLSCGGSRNNSITNNNIVNNGMNGITITDSLSVGNYIFNNNLTGNSLKNVDLNFSSGPLPITPGGPHPGPNNLQNYPTITSLTRGGGNTTVAFSLDSTPLTSFMVHAYENPNAGAPAGKVYVGQTTVTTDASGIASGAVVIGGAHDHISLMATQSSTRDTSELSPMADYVPVAAVSIAGASQDFGNVTVGTTSASRTTTLSSTGSDPYRITRLDSSSTCSGGPICASGSFSCATTCATLTDYAPGASCTITTQFSPGAVGISNTNIYVCDNTRTSPQLISLTGQGIAPAPAATLSVTSLDFGGVAVGSTSASQSVTVTSSGAAPYRISALSPTSACSVGPICTGDFSCTSTCALATDYAPGQTCVITAAYKPTVLGPASGSVFVCDNTAATPKQIALSGTGLASPPPPAPAVTVSPASIDFGTVVLGSTGGPASAKLTSSGTAAYRITGFDTSSACAAPAAAPLCASPFSCTTTCKPATDYLPGDPSGNCDVRATFTPKTIGSASTSIFVCDNTAKGSQVITLLGNGAASPPPPPPPPPAVNPLEITPASFDFSGVPAGTRSAPASFAIINHDRAAVQISSLQVSGSGFELQSTSCGSTLAAVSACYAVVVFAPSRAGNAGGFVDVTAIGSTASPGPWSARAELFGTGVETARLQLPSPIDFGAFLIGSSSPLLYTVTLTNTGNAALTFVAASVTGPFTLVNDCPTRLAAGESCRMRLEFTATRPGEFSGGLSIVTDAPGGSGVIPLVARAQLRPVPLISVSPVSIGFGNQMIGSTSSGQAITVTNGGGVAAALGALASSADFVVLSTTCGATLESLASCSAVLAMRPVGFGQRSGQLLVNSNAEGSPGVVSLVGTGCRPFAFGANRVGAAFNCAP